MIGRQGMVPFRPALDFVKMLLFAGRTPERASERQPYEAGTGNT